MLSADETQEAKRLFFAEHWKVGTIAEHMGRHRDAIRRAINAESFNRKAREVRRLIDPYVEFVEGTLRDYPRLRATRIYEMLVSRGYQGSVSQVRRTVKQLRPGPSKEAFMKLMTLPGEQAQVDWAHFGEIQIGNAARKLSAFVMVLSWSRAMHVLFTLDQQQGNFLRGHAESFAYFGGVPRVLLYDNLKSVVLQRCGKAIHFHPRLLEFSGYYHFEPRPVGVARGNEKGRVERTIRFLRERFFAARHFRDVEDLNRQFIRWREDWAHQRPCPEDRKLTVAQAFEQERGALMTLPAHPFSCDTIETRCSGKQPYIRFDLNDYSIPFELLRKPLTVRATHDTVRILDEGKEVARHNRSYDKDQVIEVREHICALAEMKHSARQSREMSAVFAHVTGAKQLLEKVVERGESLSKATRQMERLLDDYGPKELTFAVGQMLERKVTAPCALAQILEQERRKHRLKPAMTVKLSDDPRVENLRIAPPALGDYDDLSD
jgi:transposase